MCILVTNPAYFYIDHPVNVHPGHKPRLLLHRSPCQWTSWSRTPPTFTWITLSMNILVTHHAYFYMDHPVKWCFSCFNTNVICLWHCAGVTTLFNCVRVIHYLNSDKPILFPNSVLFSHFPKESNHGKKSFDFGLTFCVRFTRSHMLHRKSFEILSVMTTS